METMEENEEGNMEFPRDVMFEDCFPEMEEPLYGFITNVTVLNNSPCLLDVECFANGTSIKNSTNLNEDATNNIVSTDAILSKLEDFQGTSLYQMIILYIIDYIYNKYQQTSTIELISELQISRSKG